VRSCCFAVRAAGLVAATSERNSIVISAVLFGGFHVLTTDALPRAGCCRAPSWADSRLGGLAHGERRTRMLLHACHNGLLLTLGYYRDETDRARWESRNRPHAGRLAGDRRRQRDRRLVVRVDVRHSTYRNRCKPVAEFARIRGNDTSSARRLVTSATTACLAFSQSRE